MTNHPDLDRGTGPVGLAALLEALDAAAPRLDPTSIAAHLALLRPLADELRATLDSRTGPGEPFATAATHAISAFDLVAEAAATGAVPRPSAVANAVARALEALYPLAATHPAVSEFFIEPGRRGDSALAESLATAPADGARGVIHVDNARESRGGYSLYVPEPEATARRPLVVALHGGSGHGADFLWAWLRDARSRGAILLAPTSAGRTWSIAPPDTDSPRLDAIVDRVRRQWDVDPGRILLTGMSDGGTFAFLSSARPGAPYTHVAVCSANLGQSVLARAGAGHLNELPIYVLHGEVDRMFPVAFARLATAELARTGARVVYREVAGIGHAHDRHENAAILDWFLSEAPREPR